MCNSFEMYVVRGMTMMMMMMMIMKGREMVKPGASTWPTPVDKHKGDRQAYCPYPIDESLSTI